MLTMTVEILRATRRRRERLNLVRPCEHCEREEAEYGQDYCRTCRRLTEAATNGSFKAAKQLRASAAH